MRFGKGSYQKYLETYKWHRWFAWHPVTVTDDLSVVWLETLMRRRHSG